MTNIHQRVSLRKLSFAVVFVTAALSAWQWFSFLRAFASGAILDRALMPAISDGIVSLHADLMTAALVLVAIACFRKRIGAVHVAAALVAGFFLDVYSIMDGTLHPLLFSTGVLDVFMHPGSDQINPQYTRLLFFFLAIGTLLVLCARSATRSKERVFVALIGGAVMVTTFMFHIALPMGTLRYTKKFVAETRMEESVGMPPSAFCEERACIAFDRGFGAMKTMGPKPTIEPQAMAGFLSGAKDVLTTTGAPMTYAFTGDFQGVNFTVMACVRHPVAEVEGSAFLCFFDNTSMSGFGRTTEAWFAFLTSVAHGTWIYGGLFLLWMHKRRFFRKPQGFRLKVQPSEQASEA
jgi:hypothetical protein